MVRVPHGLPRALALSLALVGAMAAGPACPTTPTPPRAKFTIQVWVSDALTGRPVPNAMVRTDGDVKHEPTATNADGFLQWTDFTAANFNLNVDAEGYVGHWQAITEDKSQSIAIRLSPKAQPPPQKPERLQGTATYQDAEGWSNIRANFCNLNDGLGDGAKSVIYTSVLPTVYAREPARFAVWMRVLRDAGATHIFVNVPDGGPSYNGVWQQPDLWHDLSTYVEFLNAVLDTPSASGKGFVPIPFMDDGGPDPMPRLRERWPRYVGALTAAGLIDQVPGILAFEPVVGDWSSREVSEAILLARGLSDRLMVGYHGSPTRLVGSSNPVQVDDPWQGGESTFYTSHGGEFFRFAAYQTPHGRDLYDFSCSAADGASCWLDRWNDYVLRIGGGYHGWRRMPLTLMETVAYEYIRGQATSEDARRVADRGKTVCDAPFATDWMGGRILCGYGNGLPH